MEPVDQSNPDNIAKTRVVIDHLSGFYRGSRQILSGDDLEIGTARYATIHFPADHEPEVAAHHARIVRDGEKYELLSTDTAPLRVNGNLVQRHLLSPGDLIIVGHHGPVIRFRVHSGGRPVQFKTIPEALADCVDTARSEKRSFPAQIWAFLAEAPNELLRQTAPWTRTFTFALITILVAGVGFLAVRSLQFQRELETQAEALTVVQSADQDAMTVDELEDIRNELRFTARRLDELEEMTAAGRRIVNESSESIAFLIGEYGFKTGDGDTLKTIVDEDGRRMLNPNGRPAVSSSGNGPPFSTEFTGTGFVVDTAGHLLTNRHVASPWDFDQSARALHAAGYVPFMLRMVGYMPRDTVAFRVALVAASDSVDLAVLACLDERDHVEPLEFAGTQPEPGDEVFVLGYPTGIRAMLARTDHRFVGQLLEETKRDFWTIAERLARDGRIRPLATSGIVGQVTPNFVVYDAQTTHGGSGGPVIGSDGRVVAINAAILNDFGGSNLGVPVSWAVSLLQERSVSVER